MDLSKLLFLRKQNIEKKTNNISESDDISESQSISNKFDIVIDSYSSFFRLYSISTKKYNELKINLLSDDEENEFFTEEIFNLESENIKKSIELESNKRLEQIFSINNSNIKDLDETSFVYVSTNKMFAWILLFPAVGDGEKLTGSQLLQTLIDNGVTFGINYDKLYAIPKYDDRYFNLYLVAKGRLPIEGKDGSIVELYNRNVDINLPNNELSHVDYAKINLSNKIKEGGVICEIISPTQGISGITVTRDLLMPPPKNGQPAYIPKGRNTTLSEDGRYLIAKKSGYIGYSGNKFQVKPVLEIFNSIKNDDEKNINFLGDVHIHGDVCEGTVIRATGDIKIDGIIESCTLEAGENIVVMSGIQGYHGSTIRAHKSIYAKYLENCDVYAQENIKADCIIDCNIYSNGSVTTETGMGVIFRGTIRSAKGVYAKVIGSKAEIETNIILGGLPCDEVEKTLIAKELKDINIEIETISNMPKSVENEMKLSKLRLNQYVAEMKLDKFEKDFELNNKEYDLCKVVCKKVYPGTNVTIEQSTFKVNNINSDCIIGLKENGSIDYI